MTRLLTKDEVAERLGSTTRMVRKLIETRELDHVKVGRLVRVEEDAIDRYINKHRVRAK